MKPKGLRKNLKQYLKRNKYIIISIPDTSLQVSISYSFYHYSYKYQKSRNLLEMYSYRVRVVNIFHLLILLKHLSKFRECPLLVILKVLIEIFLYLLVIYYHAS